MTSLHVSQTTSKKKAHTLFTLADIFKAIVNRGTKFAIQQRQRQETRSKKKILAHVDQVVDSSYGLELISTCPDGCKTKDGVGVNLSNFPDTERGIAKQDTKTHARK